VSELHTLGAPASLQEIRKSRFLANAAPVVSPGPWPFFAEVAVLATHNGASGLASNTGSDDGEPAARHARSCRPLTAKASIASSSSSRAGMAASSSVPAAWPVPMAVVPPNACAWRRKSR
jgi:hypothetical protein